jgi:hypothetical protein
MTTEPKCPHVHVQLTGSDGNSMMIVARVRKAMRKAGVPDAQITEFTDEAMSGDYNNLLDTCMRWVDVG